MKSNAISYLLVKQFKNTLKEIVKSPAKLIYGIFMIGILVLNAVIKYIEPSTGQEYRDIRELIAGISALYILMFFLLIYNGFKNGATMFKMSDVNLLFSSPLKPSKILYYGLVKQLGTSLLLGFFILYQYGWASMVFGIGILDLLWILIGYGITVFLAQLTAMLIYFFTSYNEKRKKIVLYSYYAIILAYVLGISFYLLQDKENLIENLVKVGNSWAIRLLPVGGWAGNMAGGLVTNDLLSIVIGLFLLVFYFFLATFLVMKSNQDFYEDVLQASEEQATVLLAKKEGRTIESWGKIKKGQTGLTQGFGASVFYHKHKIENRRSRKLLMNPMSFLFLVIVIVFSLFVKNMGITSIFFYATYMQIISISMGRLAKELDKPYIYMIPENSLKKIIYAIAESFSEYLIEALLLFIALGFIMKLSPWDIVVLVIARLSFSYLILSANLLLRRIFGSFSSRTLLFLMYMLLVLIMSIPGTVVGIIIGSLPITVISAYFLTFLTMSVINILITLLSLTISKNVLDKAELR